MRFAGIGRAALALAETVNIFRVVWSCFSGQFFIILSVCLVCFPLTLGYFMSFIFMILDVRSCFALAFELVSKFVKR